MENSPKTSNEKLLFNDVLYKIKTSDEILLPDRIFTTDKEFVKLYIKAKLGDFYNIPTIAILKTRKEILDFKFPKRCVIKPTHLSGDYILRYNNEEIDLRKIINWLSDKHYRMGREANYRYLKPKIIVENFIFNTDSTDDIKFFCYKGKVKAVQLDIDRNQNHTRKLYDRNWNDLKTSTFYPLPSKMIKKPKNLDHMILAAEKLAANFNFVRIDMYTNDHVFFCGEITHVHENAGERFIPEENEKIFSKIIFED